MFTFLKLLAGSGLLTGVVRARLQAVKQAAAGVAVLTVCGLIAAAVGATCLAGAIYLALLRVMADYEAALAVGGGFILIAAVALLLAVSKPRRAISGRPERTVEEHAPPQSMLPGTDADPVVRLITQSLQSPVVVSALVLGVVAGRMTKRARRD